MPAAIHNFFIEQGSNFEIIFEYLDSNGNPIVIGTNDCVRLKFKDSNNQYRAWRNASLTAGSLLTNKEDPTLASNQIKWSLPASTTKAFTFSTASYVLDMVIGGGDPDGDTIKLATGQISIISDTFLTECEDGDVPATFKTCKACDSILPSDSDGSINTLNVTPTPSVQIDVTPTPSPSIGSTPTPTPSPVSVQEDLCDYLCRGLDIFSQLYTGSGLYINDASIVSGINTPVASSGQINISNTGIAKNIELYIDNLVHDNPSDLTLFLDPPSGDPILLSYRNKINNYIKSSGIKFAFSNKALPGTYLNNKSNNNDLYVNILKSTGICLPSPYNVAYNYSFDHLFDAGSGALSGNWNLYFIDHDSGGSGYIGGWNIIITYQPPAYNEGL